MKRNTQIRINEKDKLNRYCKGHGDDHHGT